MLSRDTVMWSVIGAVSLSLVTAAGDSFIKAASAHERPFREGSFAVGCFLYALTAAGWVYVMRRLNLAAIGAIFSVSTTIALAIIGVVIFSEKLRSRDVAGIALAIGSILLLSRAE